ncbi:MAG: hypothetical protein HYV29_08985 [Ignavibacteriales bacterium]|nr:hypothetical protein [Ignavibacteriales bacterium]
MDCLTSKVQISQFLDNELPQELLQPLFYHLGECEECRNFFVRTKVVHEGAKNVEYAAVPKELDEKFAVLEMGEKNVSLMNRKFTISVPTAIYSIGAVIVMVLFIYVSGTIQEKQIAEQYRQTMNLTMPFSEISYDRN